MFRPFLEFIGNSQKYSNYKIILFGNKVWKDITEKYDSEYIDQTFWFDYGEFQGYNKNKALFKYWLLFNRENPEIILNTVISQEKVFHELISNISAPIKITPEDDFINCRPFDLTTIYTKTIPIDSRIRFELFRNKVFIETVLQNEIADKRFQVNYNREFNNKITIFPTANSCDRVWHIDNYIRVINWIIKNTSSEVNVLVKRNELKHEIISKLKEISNRIFVFVGESIITAIDIIRDSKLVISNETGAVHLAIWQNTPVICISNGRHYGRFHPYPNELPNKASYIYPKQLDSICLSNKNEQLIDLLKYKSHYNINSIKVKTVINKIKLL